MPNSLEVPDSVTFEAAIALTQTLLDRAEQATPDPAEVETAVAKLLATHNGARGFFVAYLTDARALVEALVPAVLPALQTAPAAVSELLVKNLAMSAAMEIAHRRNNNPEQAAQSARVQRRTAALMEQLGFDYFKTDAEGLWQGIAANIGPYAAFLKRWGYDSEQQEAIAHQLRSVFPAVAATAP
ncbi:hypothetical protein [Altericista sp. CCNU0014]|uniref:hypothetical protein n=1 Tax=Altericista sp. CCNU0014 TaxID=3082949 RepID=UPI00384E0D5F